MSVSSEESPTTSPAPSCWSARDGLPSRTIEDPGSGAVVPIITIVIVIVAIPIEIICRCRHGQVDLGSYPPQCLTLHHLGARICPASQICHLAVARAEEAGADGGFRAEDDGRGGGCWCWCF